MERNAGQLTALCAEKSSGGAHNTARRSPTRLVGEVVAKHDRRRLTFSDLFETFVLFERHERRATELKGGSESSC